MAWGASESDIVGKKKEQNKTTFQIAHEA